MSAHPIWPVGRACPSSFQFGSGHLKPGKLSEMGASRIGRDGPPGGHGIRHERRNVERTTRSENVNVSAEDDR